MTNGNCKDMSSLVSTVFPIFDVPENVKDLILAFVSSGDEGLRAILNLRLVCKTTRKWIDHLPKRQADFVFSKAHVAIHCDVETLRHFLTSPPPFGITSLCLRNEAVDNSAKLSIEAEEDWIRFHSIWRSKLESLKFQTGQYCRFLMSSVLMNLKEFINLQKLELFQKFMLPNESLLPFLQNITELSVKYVETLQSKHLPTDTINVPSFYVYLENNNHLRIFRVAIPSVTDLTELTKFLNHKKEDALLQVYINMDNNIFHMVSHYSHCNVLFQNFAAAVTASKSSIRLKIDDLNEFQQLLTEFCSPAVYLELLKKVQSAGNWSPKGDSLNLLEFLPRLKRLDKIITHGPSIDTSRFKFPPLMMHLGFNRGFYAFGILPQSLAVLELCLWKCKPKRFFSLINLLRESCPRLEMLRLEWQSVNDEDEYPSVNFERSTEFSRLRKLTFTCNCWHGNVDECRVVFAKAFEWQILKLRTLELSFDMKDDVSMIQPETLTRLLEGLSARTLVTVRIAKESVTPEGLPLLVKLKSLASKNMEEQKGKKVRRQ